MSDGNNFFSFLFFFLNHIYILVYHSYDLSETIGRVESKLTDKSYFFSIGSNMKGIDESHWFLIPQWK